MSEFDISPCSGENQALIEYRDLLREGNLLITPGNSVWTPREL
jgi:hypothetical protein